VVFALTQQTEPSWWSWILNTIIIILSLFIILLVLIQRGKGGGLAGAFGGVGGSSAFGSRAGDLFTRITIIVAAVWILLIMVHVKVIQHSETPVSSSSVFPPSSPDE
jgi:preprotein translocase subunit SecG